jgi:hypothetical protein
MPMLEVQRPGDMLNCGDSVTGQDLDRSSRRRGERFTPRDEASAVLRLITSPTLARFLM